MTVALKNIPDALYQGLRKSAASNRRSLNGELIRRGRERSPSTRT